MPLIFLFLMLIPLLGGKISYNDIEKDYQMINKNSCNKSSIIRLFLSGDVMTGRGIDQVLPHPVDPLLQESYMRSATGYVQLAEKENGKIPSPVDFSYIWGDANRYWERMDPDFRIINLETAVTRSDKFWPRKAVNYRMSPENISVLTSAKIDYCALANNHILDFQAAGLTETIKTLTESGIRFSGCGESLKEAIKPAILKTENDTRVIIISIGLVDSGIPTAWGATPSGSGVYLVSPDRNTAVSIRNILGDHQKPGDIQIVSIHWGSNWGYEVPDVHTRFAHDLIDIAGVDIIHGHSSHHVRPIEVYNNRPIFYGCGDFINDYEGISGYESYRDDLTLMYFTDTDPETGDLVKLQMVPLQIRNFKLNETLTKDKEWMASVLNRECREFGTSVVLDEDGILNLNW